MNREPLVIRTAIVAAVAAVVHLLIVLGAIDLAEGGEAAIITAVDVVVALAIIFLVRPKVTPVADPTLTPAQVENVTVVNSDGAELDRLTAVIQPAVSTPFSSDTKSEAAYYDPGTRG